MQCTWEECTSERVTGSKYCKPHKHAARARWLENIKSKPSKAERDAKHQELFDRAHKAGMTAAEAHKPVPMHLTDGRQQFRVEGGACGFAWVTIRPANCSFALWLKRKEGDRVYKAYRGGMQRFAPLMTQSMSTKEAYCEAFAKVLTEGGVKTYAGSRLD